MGGPQPEVPADFDFDGALALAAHCHHVAGELRSYAAARQGLAAAALDGWEGAFAEDFRRRVTTCAGDADELRARLRRTGDLLARAWQQAATGNVHHLWAEYCRALDQRRRGVQRAWDTLFGDPTRYPPEPAPAPLPAGPDFETSFDPRHYTPPAGFPALP